MRSIKLPSWTKPLLGLEPIPIPPVVFALDESRLRYARFERTDNGFELLDYHDRVLDPDLFATGHLGGPIHDPEKLRTAIAELQEQVSGEITEGSLILPDPWLRIALVEGDDLPRNAGAREEVLRWKLQRMVPFRVEELRVRGAGGSIANKLHRGSRVLIGFGLESLLRQLESIFQDRGIHVGYISSESMTLLSAVRDLVHDVQLGAMVFISARGYSLTFVLQGQPVLHRFKALPQLAGDEPPEQLVAGDLKLTHMYLRDQFPAADIGRILLICPQAIEDRWLDWLSSGFGRPAHLVRPENLPFSAAGRNLPLYELATMLGAARQEIA